MKNILLITLYICLYLSGNSKNILDTPPTSPSHLTAIAGRGLVTINWQPSSSSGIMYYKLFRGVHPGVYNLSWNIAASNLFLKYTDSTVTYGISYYYAIKSVDSSFRESNFSPQVFATPLSVKIYASANAFAVGRGTFDYPYSTINEAMADALPMDTVIVLPGIYYENIRIKPHVYLKGSGAWSTTIEGGNDSAIVLCGEKSRISGFTIKQTAPTWKSAAIWAGRESPTIHDNVIIQTHRTFISYSGIYANGGVLKCYCNYITDFDGGISVWEGNTIAHISNNIIDAHLLGIQLGNNAGAVITNNTILIREYGSGIWAFSFPYATIQNNIIIGPSFDVGQGFNVNDNPQYQNLSIAYNNVWKFFSNYSNLVLGSGNISMDPLFIDFEAGDYRLQPNSPCIDSGDPMSSFSDQDGSRNDMGAFGGPNPIDPKILLGNAITIGIENSSGFPGDTVVINIFGSNISRLASIRFTITYNSTIAQLLTVDKSIVTQNFQLTVDTIYNNAIPVLLNNNKAIKVNKGNIIQMRFLIPHSAADNEATSLNFDGVEIKDSLGQNLLLNDLHHGVIYVSRGSRGGRYVFVDYRNNSGNENGTRYYPYKTIQRGINNSVAGDTVLIASGNYAESISLKSNIYLTGSGVRGTILQYISNEPIEKPTINCRNIKSVTISNMTILSPNIPFAYAIYSRASHIRVYNCRIISGDRTMYDLVSIDNMSDVLMHDNYIYGGDLLAVSGGSFNLFRNIFHTETSTASIKIVSGRGNISNNRMYVNGGYGIIIFNSLSPIVINNNQIRSSGTYGNGILTVNSDSVKIENNTVDTKIMGIETRNSKAIVMNNIVTGNSAFGLNLSELSQSSYNDIWGNLTDYYHGTQGIGDFSLDPQFINKEKENYRLSSNSPCINAGNPDFHYNDLDGSRNDIGVFGGAGLDTNFFNYQGASIKILGGTCTLGETLMVPIVGKFIRGIAETEFQILFNPSHLSLISSLNTSATSMFSLYQTEQTPGNLLLKLTSMNEILEDSAALIYMKFIPKQSSINTSISFQKVRLNSQTTAEIPVANVSNGYITINLTADDKPLPSEFELYQNYPNPFNSETIIKYCIQKSGNVSLIIYNILGQKVATLVSEHLETGTYKVGWDGKNSSGVNLPSGIYFTRLNIGRLSRSIKLVLLK
ncbi:MAG: right-handed parallel beta-helix repeat-containing protein [Bacteroidota bacterium]|nr:right-handed parallel beta-helix repeat-containing protein [Bacteroidota bacterium]